MDASELYKILGLKVDPKFPIHYFIGIAVNSNPSSKDRGKLFMKYNPIIFTNDDVKKIKIAKGVKKDKLIPSEGMDENPYESFGVSGIIGTIKSFFIGCRANDCTVHHFSSSDDYIFSTDDFDSMVKAANSLESSYKKLMEARVRY